jgi:hypothetical protein
MKTIGIGLFVAVVGVVLGIRSGTVRAGDEYDCSKASKWVKRTSSYDKGAVVSYKIRSSDFHYHAFRCDAGYCTDEPTHTSSWTNIGECKYGTDPH